MKKPQLIAVLVAGLVGSACAGDNVLFVGAHPDDLEACMGLALRMKDDFDVRIVDFTRGEGGCGEAGFRDGSTAEKRMAEEREVAKAFGTDPIFLSAVNFRGRYAYADEKVTKEMESVLLKYRPRAVFTHWPIDTHPDHVQCAALLQHVLFNVCRDHHQEAELYFYEEPEWETKNYHPTYYVDVSSEVDAITNLVGKYVCQNGAKIARDKVKRMVRRGQEAPRRVQYAETFGTLTGNPVPGGILDRYSIRKQLLVLHLDFNTIQMRKETVMECLQTAARAGYNAVLWEVEDKVKWETCPECVHPDAFTKDEFREILAEARRLGLEPIPLLQTFGHAEYVLQRGHEDWMEDPKFPACYCVSRKEVRRFLWKMILEYLDLFGQDVRHFHLGGDEAKAFCTCAVCSKRDRMELYVEHLNSLLGWLNLNQIKPGIWCDMILAHPDAFGKAGLSRAFTVWHWDYEYDGRGRCREWTKRIGLLEELGHDVIFVASSSSWGDGPFLPRYGAHMDNAAAAAALVRDRNYLGLCMTSWSVRKFPKSLQFPIWDFAAKRFMNPDPDCRADETAAYQRHFGSVAADRMRKMTVWSDNLMPMDATGWRPYIKDARPAPTGTFDRVVTKAVKVDADYANVTKVKCGEIAEALRAGLESFDAGEADSKVGATFVLGAGLAARFADAVADALTGARTVGVPEGETAGYYRQEQSETSATNSANVTWSVLKGR